MLDPCLPSRTVVTDRIANGFMVDDRSVLASHFLRSPGHCAKCRPDACIVAILHTVHSMALPERGIPGTSSFERGLFGLGDRLSLLAGVALAVSAFTGWYSGSGEGVRVSVTGWDSGVPGKVVFLLAIVVVLAVALRELGIELPAAVPASLLTIFLGAMATIIVLVRVISIPDDFFFAGRGVGIWISLVAAVGVIVAGLLQASEEL